MTRPFWSRRTTTFGRFDEREPVQESFQAKLEEARAALKGPQKEMAQAKRLLLEILKDARSASESSTLQTLCYVYVYLGYIEDRSGNRAAAVSWYGKAVEIKEGGSIQDAARHGLARPVTWIRHLDEAASAEEQVGRKEELSKGRVTWYKSPFPPLCPAQELSREQRAENLNVLAEAVDRTYPCFELKSIDWAQVTARCRRDLENVRTTEDFYFLLFRMVNELKDTQAYLANWRLTCLDFMPPVWTEMLDGKVIVKAVSSGADAGQKSVKVGSEIIAVDDVSVGDRLEMLGLLLRSYSTDAAVKRKAYWGVLAGEENRTVRVRLVSPGEETYEVDLARNMRVRYVLPRTYPFDVTKQQFVHFGRHPSGLGYIHVESFRGREEIADEFDAALDSLRATPALIIDLRQSTGTMGHSVERILGRFLGERALVGFCVTKTGPGRDDLEKIELYRSPTGDWPYLKPVAMLTDEFTFGPADALVCFMKSTGRVLTVGSTSHGSLTGDAVYAALPCNLMVSIPNSYLCDAKGTPMEGKGNVPDVAVTPTIADLVHGADPVLDKAVAALKERM